MYYVVCYYKQKIMVCYDSKCTIIILSTWIMYNYRFYDFFKKNNN